jgi:hypothetical protein
MTQPLEPGAIPPSTAIVGVPELKAAVAAYENAVQAAKTSDRELVRLERSNARALAEQADAQELADALEAGQPAPKPRHLAEHEQRLQDAKREASARAMVAQRAWTAVVEAFAKHRARLVARTEKEIESRRAAYLKSLGQFESDLRRLAEIEPMQTFLAEDGRMGGGVYRQYGALTGSMPAPAPHALDPNQVLVADVLKALREIAVPPPPPVTNPDQLRKPGEHVPLAQQGRIAGVAPAGGPAQFGASPPVRVPG